jgi:apolipoprotein N-acyltransferase
MTLAARRGLAVGAGLLLYFSFPNWLALGFEPWTGAVACVALAPLLAALDGVGARTGFGLGCLAGLAFHGPGLHWLTMVQPLGWGAVPAWLGLAAWCALFVGLFGALAAHGLAAAWPLPLLWLPAAWALMEWLRSQLLTGFPWNSLGSSQYGNAFLRPLAAVTGPAGLDYAVALLGALAWALLWRPRLLTRVGALLPTLAVLLALAGGAAWAGGQAERQLAAGVNGPAVAVVQGGIDLDQPWDRDFRAEVMAAYMGYSGQAADAGAQVILWPESAFPGFFNEDAPEAEAVKAFARRRHVSLLIGSTLSGPDGYRNAAIWVDADGSTRAYVKRHLVPFGEYLPLEGWIPGLHGVLERMGVAFFRPGTEAARFQGPGVGLVPLICFEGVFPEMARQGPAPDVLALLTVDTWYGVTAGPVWHASQAALRAVENGCWSARAAATGISLFAAPDGSLRGRLPLGGAGWVLQRVGPGQVTPYRRWGSWFLLTCVILLLGLAIYPQNN